MGAECSESMGPVIGARGGRLAYGWGRRELPSMDGLPKSIPPVVLVFSSGRERDARLAEGEPEGDAGEPVASERRFGGGMPPVTGDSQNQSPRPGDASNDEEAWTNDWSTMDGAR